MKPVFILLFFLQSAFTIAQVHVRGYYRSNGTYVRPHERTRPNHTITDNYSYPGNYNPNTGRVNSGNSYSNGSSIPVSPSEPINTVYSQTSYSSKTTPIRYKFAVPVERELLVNGAIRNNYIIAATELQQLPKGSKITIIGKDYDSYRTMYNGTVAYIHYSYIEKDYATFLAQNYPVEVQAKTKKIIYTLYTKVKLDSPLTATPSWDAETIYEIPAGSVIKVRRFTNTYWDAQVNGVDGYIGSMYVAQTSGDSASVSNR